MQTKYSDMLDAELAGVMKMMSRTKELLLESSYDGWLRLKLLEGLLMYRSVTSHARGICNGHLIVGGFVELEVSQQHGQLTQVVRSTWLRTYTSRGSTRGRPNTIQPDTRHNAGYGDDDDGVLETDDRNADGVCQNDSSEAPGSVDVDTGPV
jgi:hypothetical protein